ncbi:hypothetical protein [Mycoplasmopsis primatum]|uniref:hypothetical protein n=1 Tax=Mycoplasmopsis primatum TaxID=55604 RepID=UPI000495C30E|nr:hypothetical protein [Mycoplasmopsis primatum]
MIKNKIFINALITSMAINTPILISASCSSPNSNDIVEFRLSLKKLNPKFVDYGIVNEQELAKKLETLPLKVGEFTLVYPDSETLQAEAKKIKEFFETKKVSNQENIYKETYKAIMIDKKKVSLNDFTNEYLWARNLIKIKDNGSIKNTKNIEVYIDSFLDSTNGSAVVEFKARHKKDYRIREIVGNSAGCEIKYNNKLKTITASHYHMTKEILEKQKDNLEILLKSNESSQWI